MRCSLACFAKVDSPYWQHNPGSEERLPGARVLIPVITPRPAARAIVRGVQRGGKTMTAPFMVRVVEVLDWLTPPARRFNMDATGYRRPGR